MVSSYHGMAVFLINFRHHFNKYCYNGEIAISPDTPQVLIYATTLNLMFVRVLTFRRALALFTFSVSDNRVTSRHFSLFSSHNKRFKDNIGFGSVIPTCRLQERHRTFAKIHIQYYDNVNR